MSLWAGLAFSQSTNLEWLNPKIDCTQTEFSSYEDNTNVFVPVSKVQVRRNPEGILFVAVNVIFGECSSSIFTSHGARNLTNTLIERLPWKKTYVEKAEAYYRTNTQNQTYNHLEVRVNEEKLNSALEKNDQVSVVVNYNEFSRRGVMIKWIFKKTESGTNFSYQAQ